MCRDDWAMPGPCKLGAQTFRKSHYLGCHFPLARKSLPCFGLSLLLLKGRQQVTEAQTTSTPEKAVTMQLLGGRTQMIAGASEAQSVQ